MSHQQGEYLNRLVGSLQAGTALPEFPRYQVEFKSTEPDDAGGAAGRHDPGTEYHQRACLKTVNQVLFSIIWRVTSM